MPLQLPLVVWSPAQPVGTRILRIPSRLFFRTLLRQPGLGSVLRHPRGQTSYSQYDQHSEVRTPMMPWRERSCHRPTVTKGWHLPSTWTFRVGPVSSWGAVCASLLGRAHLSHYVQTTCESLIPHVKVISSEKLWIAPHQKYSSRDRRQRRAIRSGRCEVPIKTSSDPKFSNGLPG